MKIEKSDVLTKDALSDFPVVQHQSKDGLSCVEESKQVRRDIVDTLFAAGGGHYGGGLSVVDILVTLYRRILRVSAGVSRHVDRDRLILSKGHAAVALYAMLRRLGYFDWPLTDYAEFSSPLEGHPDMTSVPGVDFSTGSLGQGLSVGIGMAIALRGIGQRIWVVLGDGECQEGQVWESAMLAASCKLDNIYAIVDCNRFQEWGWAPTADDAHPEPVSDLALKWRAFGWHVIECDGHDHVAIERAASEAIEKRGQPSIILAHTKKGKGVPMVESNPTRFHCETVSPGEHQLILESLK